MRYLKSDASGLHIALTPRDLEALQRALRRLREALNRGECPVAQRQGPGAAFAQEDGLRKELSDLLDRHVRSQKAQQLSAFEQTILSRDAARRILHVPRGALAQWVACLNDLRLLIAAELGLPPDWASMKSPPSHGRAAQDWLLFMAMTDVQEQIVRRELAGLFS
jgi:hypothetical protein